MIWLISFLAMGLIAVAVLTVVLAYLERQKWMRIFCDKLEIPIHIMEGEEPKKEDLQPAPPRKRISVPVPGAYPDMKPPSYATKAMEKKK